MKGIKIDIVEKQSVNFLCAQLLKKLKQCFAAVDWIKAFIKNNEGKKRKNQIKFHIMVTVFKVKLQWNESNQEKWKWTCYFKKE